VYYSGICPGWPYEDHGNAARAIPDALLIGNREAIERKRPIDALLDALLERADRITSVCHPW
jgi:hypothetical protein